MRTLGLCGLLLMPAVLVAGETASAELPAPTDEALVIEPATTPVSTAQPADEGWIIAINPMPKATIGEDSSPAAEYAHYYDAIPFSRAEWLANASYRHDSAMALLTGQPINGRTAPTRMLEEYQNPRTYRRTFFPRLSPADLHYQYSYGFGPFGYYSNWWLPGSRAGGYGWRY